MNILQGTTPTLTITVDTDDFNVSDVTELELAIKNGSTLNLYGLSDVTLDSTENTIAYQFTEAETLALDPKNNLVYQLRFMFSDGSIVGTNALSIRVSKLYSTAVMTNE